MLSAKWAVAGSVLLALVFKRDEAVFTYVLGGACSSFASKFLKMMIMQARPTKLKPDPGMPSSHSTNLFFLSMYLHFTLPTSPGCQLARVGSLLGAVVLSAHRVRANHHTVAQIVAGAVLGTSLAFVWTQKMDPLLLPRIRKLLWMMGDTNVLCLSILLSGVAVLAMGPGDRMWKAKFVYHEPLISHVGETGDRES
jgi:dolichyldiphosphatase